MITRHEKVCIVRAPCKINLHLSISGKRPDGFHDLKSLFACLALSDTIKFTVCGKDGECALSTNEDLIAVEDNLVYKAVFLFRERTGYSDGLSVNLTKRIPIGAGLGGGSSDAASTLLALNALAGSTASTEELAEMAAVLGSDVPFFLGGGLAFVSGRGEIVEPIEMSISSSLAGLGVVLVKPHFSSDTAAAYRLLDEYREQFHPKPSTPYSSDSSQPLIRALTKAPDTWPFYNDFLPVFLAADREKSSTYQTILEDLKIAGAAFSSLSGAGSACFGIFPTPEMAKKAVNQLAARGNSVVSTFFLANRTHTVVK